MSFKIKDHYDLRKHLHVDHNMIFYEEQKSSCDECHSKLKTTTTWENTCTLTITWFFMKSECWMPFWVEDHYDLKKHLQVDHNMIFLIFYKERKSSCVECHSQFKITTTWKTYSGWPWHDFLWRAKKFVCWMSFRVEDHYDLRKHLHVDHNMIFYEEQKSSCDECHSKLKTTTT